MRRIVIVAVALLLVAACNQDGGGNGGPVGVGYVVDNARVGDRVDTTGRISLLGELFCPCFHLTSDGGTVVVWYDLMVDDGGAFPAVDIGGLENGDTAVVIGEYRTTDPGSGYPVIWAEEIRSSD